jgi:pullulanase
MTSLLSLENLRKSHTALEWYEIFSSPEFDSLYAYPNNDLGCNYSPLQTTFNIWAPTATKVSVNIYQTGNYKTDTKTICTNEMIYKSKGLWTLTISKDLLDKYYTYAIEVDGVINETTDPYGKACGVNGKRNMIIDLNMTNPNGWDKDLHIFYPINKSIIYELHVGDFSNDPSCGIDEKYRGKYLAFTFKDTYLNNNPKNKDKPTCLNYLSKLGITTVHLLPVYDFGSVEEDIDELNKKDDIIKDANYNWGYDPYNYNIPEGSYSTNPYDGKIRIKEFKQMIQALHSAKLSVIMDVVYNHTYRVFLSNFDKSVPYYYYRQKKDGTKSNASGCGNDTASERKMVHDFIVNSILYWVKEYHIDGFRFDLMGLHDLDLMKDIREKLNTNFEFGDKIILYGEPWITNTHISVKGFTTPLCDKSNIDKFPKGLGGFHDEFRDSVKGSTFNKNEKGFVSGSLLYKNEEYADMLLNNFRQYFTGAINVNGCIQNVRSDRLINYVSCHDNNTLWDKLIIVENNLQEEKYNKIPGSFPENRNMETDDIIITPKKLKCYSEKNKQYFLEKNEIVIKRNKLAAAVIMFSFGVPFFLAGEEGARTKLGEHNSYNLPKNLNMINWERMYQFEELILYYKKIIQIRKRLNNFYLLNRVKYYNINDLPKGIVGFNIQRILYGEFKEIIIIFNSTENDYTYQINKKGKWVIIFNGQNNKNNNEDIYVEKNLFIVNAISAGIIGIKDE